MSEQHPARPTSDFPPVPPLIALADMPKIFGVSRQWVDTMRLKRILPPADGYVGRTPYWIRERIVDWWKTNPNKRTGK